MYLKKTSSSHYVTSQFFILFTVYGNNQPSTYKVNLFKPKNWHYEIEVKMLITLVTPAWYVSGTYPNPFYYYYYISFDFALFIGSCNSCVGM